MGHVVTEENKRTITWNDNPHGNQTYAVLLNDTITEFVVQDTNGLNMVYNKDVTDLTHLRDVITALLAEIAAP